MARVGKERLMDAYERAKAEATARIVSRRAMSREELTKLSLLADRAMVRLRAAFKK